MSRLKLKKALAQLSDDQLRELLLQLYDVRKEAKEYLEFLMDPDIGAKYDETVKALEKETSRYKSRYRRLVPAYRMTNIRALMKHFAGFGPEDEMYAELWFNVLIDLCTIWTIYDISDSQLKSLVKFLSEFLSFVDKAGLFSANIKNIESLIDDFPDTYYGRLLAESFMEAVARFAEEKKTL